MYSKVPIKLSRDDVDDSPMVRVKFSEKKVSITFAISLGLNFEWTVCCMAVAKLLYMLVVFILLLCNAFHTLFQRLNFYYTSMSK